jgi:hypothetical protein
MMCTLKQLQAMALLPYVDWIGNMVVKMEHVTAANVAVKSQADCFANDNCHPLAMIICTGTPSVGR